MRQLFGGAWSKTVRSAIRHPWLNWSSRLRPHVIMGMVGVLVACHGVTVNAQTQDTPPAGYVFCAAEGAQCNFSGDATVVYGARTSWTTARPFTSTVACNTAAFGTDPLPFVAKSCYYRPAEADVPPAGFTRCATEGAQCSFTGTAEVVFGGRTSWTSPRGFSSPVACARATFGADPLPGVVKSCYFRPAQADAPPAGFTRCASEGAQCSVSEASEVVFGAGSSWTTPRVFSISVACSRSTFGTDPLPGVVKSCYSRVATPDVPPAGYTLCAAEGAQCSFTGTASVVFGARNSWTAPRAFSSPVSCTRTTFGTDPIPMVFKSCYQQAINTTPSIQIAAPLTLPPTPSSFGWDGSTYVEGEGVRTVRYPTAPATVPLEVAVSYAEASIRRVEYYSGSTLVGTANAPPYNLNWTGVPSGDHLVTARAIASNGATRDSEPLFVTVDGGGEQCEIWLASPAAGRVVRRQTGSSEGSGLVSVEVAGEPCIGSVAEVWVWVWTESPYVEILPVGRWHRVNTSGPLPTNVPVSISGPVSFINHITAYVKTPDGAIRTTSVVGGLTVVDPSITLALSDPPAGSSAYPTGSVFLTANVVDCTDCTTRVDFYNGAVLVGSDPTAPYELPLELPAGTHQLTARAVDFEGQTMVSAARTVVVSTPPTVSLASPANNASFPAPATITLNANAADADGSISRVRFFNGTTQLGADDSSAPYSFTWTGVPTGTYTLTARAYDNFGLSTDSAPITVTVGPGNPPPTVSLTSPAAGATFASPATVNLAAAATDNGSIANVTFFANGTQVGAPITSAPYTFSWINVSTGTYQLTARATDNQGAVTTSAPRSITVTGIEVTYIHTDISGSPLAATNANGNVVWKENYSAYGERQLDLTTAEGQSQWFHGKEVDVSTGLQYFGARYYDPVAGRFMGVDPVGFQEDNLHSFNRYAYGNNNPVRYLDPDGNLPILLLIPLTVKAADFVLTGVELYGAYQTGGLSALGIAAAENAAWSVVPGAKTGKTIYKFGHGAEGAAVAAKGLAANVSWKGFSKGSLATHFEKHGAEFGNITQSEYLKQAKAFSAEAGAFLEQKVGNFIVKYDPASGRTLVGHAGSREIRTFYKADGRSEDPFKDALELAGQLSGR